MKINQFLIAIFFVFTFLSFCSVVSAQFYCTGGATCSEQGFETVCSNGGASCNGNKDCGVGGRCVSKPVIVDQEPGTCLASGGGCHAACPYGGFAQDSCGVYYPPPPPEPIQTNPPPSPTCSGSECDDTEDPPPPPSYYGCDGCSGTCTAGAGTETESACSANCQQLYQPGSAACPDPPSVHSTSSCADVQDSAVEDIVMPGQTVTWYTWNTPPGNTPAERLENESPGVVFKKYTSPGDMITIAYMFRPSESQPHSFYLYDRKDKTFFFYVDKGKPPVIASRKQYIVDKAIADGYTLITDTSTANAAYARTIEKRVYKLSDDEDAHPWKDANGTPYGIVSHMPWGQTLYHIPYLNCASLFRASGHGDYYSTALSSKDVYYCFRRQYLVHGGQRVSYPISDDEDVVHVAGNYFGLEQDLAATAPPDDPHAWWGRDNPETEIGETIGSMIWPITGLLVGPRYNRFDHMMYAFMEKMSDYKARPDSNNQNFTPGYVRQAIMQIPANLLTVGDHDVYAYIGMGDPAGTTPVPDENSSQGCAISPEGTGKEFYVPAPPTGTNESYTVSPRCENFTVTEKDTGREIKPGDRVIKGRTYTVRTNAKAKSRVLSFYNSSFKDPDVDPNNEIDNWRKNGGITQYEVVDCGNNCPQGYTDIKILKVSGSDQNTSNIQTDYINSYENVTGHTFTVEFWAKVDSGSKTIPHTLIDRQGHILDYFPYDAVSDPADTRDLRFPNLDTADPNDTTSSITVTSEWQKFSGTVTFNYDTDDPTGHPNGNTSTGVRVTLGVPTGNATIYYDDVTIIGWKQPTVYYRMTSAIAGDDDENTFDQCSNSNLSADYGATFTNLSGGLFWSDMTIKNDAPTGNYNIFAALQTSTDPLYTYLGNPNDNDNCSAADPAHWDDSIAAPPLTEDLDACMRSVQVVSCNETVPATPTIKSVNFNTDNTLPNKPTDANPFNDLRISDDQLTIIAEPGGNATQQAAVTSMVMTVSRYNSDTPPSELIEGVKLGNSNQYKFTYDIKEDFSNEITITLTAINNDSCTGENNQRVSPDYIRNIRLMIPRYGSLIEVPKTQVDTYACNEIYSTLKGTSEEDRLLTPPTGTNMTFQTTDTFGTFTPELGSYSEFKKFWVGAIGHQYATDLPYNPLNDGDANSWRNKIINATLKIPATNEEETYVCVNQCNADASPGTGQVWCNIDGNKIPQTNNPYFVDDLNVYVAKGNFNDAWWQSRGGLIFANNTINSALPIFDVTNKPRQLCDSDATTTGDPLARDVCQPFIAAKAFVGPTADLLSNLSAGIVMTNSNTAIQKAGWVTQNSNAQPSAISANMNNIEDYNYFYDKVDKGTTKVNSISTTIDSYADISGASAPNTYDADDGNLKVFVSNSGGLQIDLRGAKTIAVPANQKIVIFVNGDVLVYADNAANQTNKITVGTGGYLGIFASGNITFERTIGIQSSDITETSTQFAPAVQGVFFANGTLTIDGDGDADKKFIGRGSFIGRGGVRLLRDFTDSTDEFAREKNSYSPTEQFIFDPALLVNTPDLLRQPDLRWQETN